MKYAWYSLLLASVTEICLLLTSKQLQVNAARLAAAIVARQEAQQKREDILGFTSKDREIQKELADEVEVDIRGLLQGSKEYKQHEMKLRQEEELAEFDPKMLENDTLWKNEYKDFLKARGRKDMWELAGIIGGVGTALAGGFAAFSKSPGSSTDHSGGSAPGRLKRKAGAMALAYGVAGVLSWFMRHRSKKLAKYHNARLSRMQFEARTGLKPTKENVLGPEESEILKPKSKKKSEGDDSES